MEDNVCIRLCMNCKWRCVVKKKNGVISHYGCFGKKGYEEFVRDFNRTKIIRQVYALSPDTGEFVSPLKEFSFTAPSKSAGMPPVEGDLVFSMDGLDFHGMLKKSKADCPFRMEMELVAWCEGNQ